MGRKGLDFKTADIRLVDEILLQEIVFVTPLRFFAGAGHRPEAQQSAAERHAEPGQCVGHLRRAEVQLNAESGIGRFRLFSAAEPVGLYEGSRSLQPPYCSAGSGQLRFGFERVVTRFHRSERQRILSRPKGERTVVDTVAEVVVYGVAQSAGFGGLQSREHHRLNRFCGVEDVAGRVAFEFQTAGFAVSGGTELFELAFRPAQ